MDDFWIILTGILVAVNCGLLGVFLILRKMAMVGDAISHAVLPGIVLAYLISGGRDSVILLIGAAAFGLLTTYLIEVFYKFARIQADASIGITFTWLFAIGVIMITLFAGNIDLDQECVLYGDIAYVPFDQIYLDGGGSIGPVSFWLQLGNLLLILLLIIIGYRGLLITGFDSSFASGLGISTGSWHYILMGAVSLTVVLSFSEVGAILVVAFLVVPPSAAYLLSKSLNTMLWLTALFGSTASIMGFYMADLWDVSISGSMALASGIIFAIILVISKLYRSTGKSRQLYFNTSNELSN
jgi:manganese/zinc/iron transport system permease protein